MQFHKSGCPSLCIPALLDFTAYLLIPVSTILFVRGSNWLTTNFSVLGSGLDRKNAFTFWALLVGIYFFCVLHMISRRIFPAPRGTSLISLALILLSCAVTTPYLPESLPFPSFLHVLFSFSAAVCLSAFLVLLLWQISRKYPGKFTLYQVGLSLILLCSALLLCIAGIVSSALEIFFSLSAAVFCRRLLNKVSL